MKTPSPMLALFLVVLLVACREEAQTEKAPPAFTGIPPEVEALLERSETTLAGLGDLRYNALYMFKGANTQDTTSNVFTMLLRPLPGDAFGYKVFARNFGGYHVLYDGRQVFAGDPTSKTMKLIDSTQQPAAWMEQSFAGKARIGLHHGSLITERIRNSENILSMNIEKSTWEDAPASTVHITFGAKPPVTGGSLDIVFRDSDALPVSLTETLDLEINGKKQRQIMKTSYIEIDRQPKFPEGQFSREALPKTVSFE